MKHRLLIAPYTLGFLGLVPSAAQHLADALFSRNGVSWVRSQTEFGNEDNLTLTS